MSKLGEEERERINDIFSVYKKDENDEKTIMALQEAKKKAQSKNEELAIKAETEKMILFEELNRRRRDRHINQNKIKKEKKKEKNKKKRKKKIIKKKKKNENNFLLETNEFKEKTEEEKEEDNLFNTWKHVLEKKIMQIFPPNKINRNALVKNCQTIINEIEIKKLEDEEVNNNISQILNYDNYIIEPEKEKNEELNSTNKSIEQNVENRKNILRTMKKDEKKYVDNQKKTKEFIEKIKRYKNEMSQRHIKKINDEDFKMGIIDLSENEGNRIRERIINFNLKTFDTFNLEKIIKFWMIHSEKVKINLEDNKNNNNNIKEGEKKKHEKAVNVKYVYTSPSEDIKKIIPFASKKYSIQKKE